MKGKGGGKSLDFEVVGEREKICLAMELEPFAWDSTASHRVRSGGLFDV